MFKIIGWIISSIFFLIGFYHTGMGLQQYNILGWQYGSFILAFGILLMILLAYSKAIKGLKIALALYLFFALVNFICNLNSLYPNEMTNILFLEELQNKKEEIESLTSRVKTASYSITESEVRKDIASEINSLTAQIRDRGYSSKSQEIVRRIESKLGLNPGDITDLTRGETNHDWELRADNYKEIINKFLDAYLEKKKNNSDNPIVTIMTKMESKYITQINNQIKLLSGQGNLIKNDSLFSTTKQLLINVTNDLNSNCAAINAIVAKSNKNFKCENYQFKNADMFRFSHTFKSIFSHLNNTGTWLVIAICLIIDFIIPLAMYLLLVNKTENNEDDWLSRYLIGNKMKKI